MMVRINRSREQKKEKVTGMCKLNIKRAVCAVLAGSVCMASGMTGFAAAFSDINGHWAQSVIEKWSDKGVIQGYEGKFNPDDSIIRGDMAVILNKLMSYTQKGENNFSDLDDNAYFAESVLKLNKAEIMFGADGFVRPRDYITREEAFVMLDRVYNFTGSSESTGFEDEAEISDWAKKAILAMCENKIINGRDGKINPKSNITRAEIIQLLENIAAYLEKVSGKIEDELEFIFGGGSSSGGSSGGISIGGGTSSGGSSSGGTSGGSSGGTSGGTSGGSSGGSSSGETDEDDNSAAIGGDELEVGGIW